MLEGWKMEKMLEGWKKFYREVFNLEVDLSELVVPEKVKGFNWLIVVVQGMTPQRVYDKCAELFDCWNCWKGTTKNLDDVVRSERTSEKTYAVWVRNRIEADEELRDFSADELRLDLIPVITLPERLLMELKYYTKTGEHLDCKNSTLCSGSRYLGYSDGFNFRECSGGFEFVPVVYCMAKTHQCVVDQFRSDISASDRRPRQVVTLSSRV